MVNVLKNKILQLFVLIDKFIYSFFKAITKVDNKLIIFEGQMGRFDESSWVLYHYLRKKRKYRFIWMVKNPKQFETASDTKFISRYHYTLNIVADFYYAKAGYSFYTHTTSSIRYRRQGQKKVFVGHGYAIKGGKANGRTGYNNFDFAMAIGKEAIATQALFVGCEESYFLPLGLPRNDLLVRHKGVGIDNPFVKSKNFKKVIIWMPTFRETKSPILSELSCATDTGLPLFDTEDKVNQLNRILNANHIGVILKLHRLQLEKEVFKQKFSNIIIITDDDIEQGNRQLYEIIGYSDALLTDYSSISVDYLLLDKPIGYILSDINYYMIDRGFTSENPLDLMVGQHIYTIDDFKMFISDILLGKDNFQTRRTLLKQRLHAAPNGDSCKLIEDYFNL